MQSSLAQSIKDFVNRRLVSSASDEKTGSRPELALTVLYGVAFLCLVAYCGFSAAAIIVGSAKLIPNQTDNTYPESVNIYAAVEAVRTGHLYALPSQPPYVLQPFGPLYYAINAKIAQASHLDFDLIRTRARLLTYSCFLLSGVIIFLICGRLQFSTVSSTLAALSFLGQPYVLTWNVTVRPDMLFLMIMLLSLLWAVEGDTLGGAGYVLSGILAALAFLIKQPGIAAPIAVLMILLYKKKLRTATVYALSTGLPVVLVLGALLWHGGPFPEQFASVGKGIWSLQGGVIFAFDKLLDMTLLVPIAIGAIGFVQAIREVDAAPQTIAAFAAANWVVGFCGLPQLGSDVNYFLPGLAGCALLLPFAIQMIRRNLRSKAYFVIIILALFVTTSLEVHRESWAFFFHLQQPETPYVALGRFKILSDRPVFTVHGRDPDLLDPFTSHELELTRHWTPSPIVANIRRGDYDLIILDGNANWQVIGGFRGIATFSPAIVRAINENYRVLCSATSSAVLEPRIREVEIDPAVLGPVLGQPCDTGLHGRAPNLTVPPDPH